MDEIQKAAIAGDTTAQEAIEKAAEDYPEVSTEVPLTTGKTQVEGADNPQGFADMAVPATGIEDGDGIRDSGRTPNGDGIRDIGFSKGEEVDIEVPDELKQRERAKQRMAEIEAVNEELKARGNKRRYVASEKDAPDVAHVFEDDFGKYYYEKVDFEVRPSTLAEFAEVKDVAALDEEEAVVKALEFLAEMYADPLIDATSKEAAESWLDRHFILASDDAGSDDVFSPEFKSQLAELVAQASAKAPEQKEKGRVYISDPSEAPEDAQVHEGDQGGYYYETGGGGGGGDGGDGDGDGGDGGGGASPSDFGIDPQETAEEAVYQTVADQQVDSPEELEEVRFDITQQVYDSVEQAVFDETDDIDVAQEVAGQVSEQADELIDQWVEDPPDDMFV